MRLKSLISLLGIVGTTRLAEAENAKKVLPAAMDNCGVMRVKNLLNTLNLGYNTPLLFVLNVLKVRAYY